MSHPKRQRPSPEDALVELLEHARACAVAAERSAGELDQARRAVGVGLRHVRELRDLSRTQVAAKARLTVAHLAGIESGRRVTERELTAVLKALDVNQSTAASRKRAA